jgi:hypothetical protein
MYAINKKKPFDHFENVETVGLFMFTEIKMFPIKYIFSELFIG